MRGNGVLNNDFTVAEKEEKIKQTLCLRAQYNLTPHSFFI
jgi:hypothetical protein